MFGFDIQNLLHGLDLFGIAVFAISGSLAAGQKQMDLFGVIVLATVSALGGGTFRDLLLNVGLAVWITDPTYLIVTTTTAILMFFVVRSRDLPSIWLAVADAIGLAVFTVIGTETALEAGISASIAVVMGIMTGVVGGMVRDVLSGEIPLILRHEIYATASLCGAVTYVGLLAVWDYPEVTTLLSLGVTLAIRLSAIRWHISLPIYMRNIQSSSFKESKAQDTSR